MWMRPPLLCCLTPFAWQGRLDGKIGNRPCLSRFLLDLLRFSYFSISLFLSHSFSFQGENFWCASNARPCQKLQLFEGGQEYPWSGALRRPNQG